ncbi:MAG TPA: CRTAC1 family protein [Candidatus Cybelea sp.]|nr:CRTAC1 family protein [Candidatus Cybelea sp.]
MKITRRMLLLALPFGASAWRLLAQGVASRNVQAQRKLPPSGRPFHAQFVDVAHSAGLVAPVIYGPPDHNDYILETTGCGCAFVDYDNDGWMDIFLLSGTRLEGLPPGTTNRLYHNNRDGTFADVTEKAGLERVGWAAGVCVGDYNNDGFEDIFCTYYGQNVLYRNNGDGTFSDVTRQAGLLYDGPTRWGSGCTFIDYDGNGLLDLYVANYVGFDVKVIPKPGHDVNCAWRGVPVECGPRGLPFTSRYLYRNNGDGTFTDVSGASEVGLKRECYGMTAVCADLDEDGWPDIYNACDSSPSLLFMNHRDGTFREEGVLRGVALNEDGMEQAGMGIAIGDYNLDGHLDLYKTHFTDDTNVLYRNDGTGNFDDVTTAARLGVETRYTCWGTGMADLDNDGWPDIFTVAGSVYPGLERELPQYVNKCPRLLFRNLGNGTFEELGAEAGPAITEAHSSRGCAFGDFDNDGDVDILIVNMNEPPSLLRNDVRGSDHWLKVKLIGTKSNRSAIGARVLVRYGKKLQAQAVTSQASFFSANDPRLHFGLGAERTADIDVYWPSGHAEKLKAVAADQLVTIQEGAGIVPSKGWPAANRKP